MARSRRTYTDLKAHARQVIEDFLADAHPNDQSVSLSEIRRLCHYSGIDAFLGPILRDMEAEGVISVWKEGTKGIVYLLKKEVSE